MNRFLTITAANLLAAAITRISAADGDKMVRVTGIVQDAATNKPVECRLYIAGADKCWYFPESSDSHDVVVYKRENYWDKNQVEMHATIAAKPFNVVLPAGNYTVIVERGKEYVPLKANL